MFISLKFEIGIPIEEFEQGSSEVAISVFKMGSQCL